jgi:hypothetical protein
MEKYGDISYHDVPSYIEHQRGFKWIGKNYGTLPDEMKDLDEERQRQIAVDDYLSEVLRDKPDHPVHKRIKYRKEI